MYVSLSSSTGGNACAVANAIQKFGPKREQSQFFDWVICSLRSINEVLFQEIPIEFDICSRKESNQYAMVSFLHYDLLTSVHDFHLDNCLDPIIHQKNIEKYNRRKKRLLDLIRNEQSITFIRAEKSISTLDVSEILIFINEIKKINPELNFNYVIAVYGSNIELPLDLEQTNICKLVVLGDVEPIDYAELVERNKLIFN